MTHVPIGTMKELSYKEIKGLLKQYRNKYDTKLDRKQSNLCDELVNKITDLDDLTIKIQNLLNELLPATPIIAAGDLDIVQMGHFKIKLKRADPDIPIAHDNTTIAFSRNLSDQKQRELYQFTELFYHLAHRVADITQYLPGLKSFDCREVKIVCNQLIKHS